jgi:hypothetical protein
MPNRTAVQLELHVVAQTGDWDPRVIEEWRPLTETVERAVAAMEAIKESGDYTPQGKVTKLREVHAQAVAKIQPFRDQVARMDKHIERVTADAVPKPKERDLAALFLEREIRDRLMAEGADTLAVAPKYFDAIIRGDETFVHAGRKCADQLAIA